MAENQERGGEIAAPDADTQVELPDPAGNQDSNSEVVISGGDFRNSSLGPETHNTHIKATKFVNSTVHKVKNVYIVGGNDEEASTSGLQQPKRRRVEEPPEVEEGYIRISDDILMDEREPVQEGCNVYKGYQEHESGDGPPIRLPVAIKRIVPSLEKHKKEVQHLATLAAHPNVVRIIQSKEHKTPHARVLYIVMELCSFQNLQDYLDENREKGTPFNFKKTMDFTRQLLNGMKYIHDKHVVHRDVKPENVLLSLDKMHLKYSDFGLGKELRRGRSSTRVTIQGQGTEGYRAPETYTSDKVSKSSDIFSLGITLFALWSNGNHPFGPNIHLRDNNIITNTNHDFSGVLITGTQKKDFLDLMDGMLQHDPSHRLKIDGVMKHFFFNNAPAEVRPAQESPMASGFADRAVETVPKEPGSSSSEPQAQSNAEEGAVHLIGRTYFAPEEQASRLRQEHKYEDAIEMLEGLEPNERQQTILAECYFHAGKDKEASECMQLLKTIISSSPDHPTPDDAIKKVETHIDNSLFIQALILLPSAAEICKNDSDPKDALWGFVLCVWRGSSIVDSLYKQGGRMRSIAKTVATQTLHQIYDILQNYTGADDDKKTDMASRCLNDIGSAYLAVENYEEATKFMQQGIDRMKSHFGPHASKYSVYDRLLNNLGVVVSRLGRHEEAEKLIYESLKACESGTDYLSEREREETMAHRRESLRRLQLRKKGSQIT